MTTQGWVAIAAALVLASVPAAAPARVERLAGAGRLGAAGRAHPRGRPRSLPAPALVRLGMIVAVGSIALTGGVLLAAAAAAACGTAWFVARDAARRRLAAARHGQLVMALRVLIGDLESGARASAALSAAAELAPAHAVVLTSAAAAAETGDAGTVLAADPSTRAIGFAWRLGEQAGAELSGVLARVARDLAAEQEQRRSVAVALAGPRASATVLAGLPLLGVALGAAMGARPWAFLIGAGPGRGVCCVGVLLDVAGVLWMRRILRRAERG